MNRPALRRLFRAGYTTSLHLWLHLRSIFPPQNPLHLYPESPQKLHPNVQLNAPAPRINSRIFFLVKAKGNNKDRFAHHLKVANRSIFVAQTSPARCVSEREKGGDFAPAGSKGRSPWHAFGDFRRETKVTRVQGGAPALEEQGLPSLQNPPGWRGGAPPHGGVGASSPHFGEQEPSLATCSRGSAAPRKELTRPRKRG